MSLVRVLHVLHVLVVPLRGQVPSVRLVVRQLHQDHEDQRVEEQGVGEDEQARELKGENVSLA